MKVKGESIVTMTLMLGIQKFCLGDLSINKICTCVLEFENCYHFYEFIMTSHVHFI